MTDLSGHIALVTGASSGIGAASAAALGAAGTAVAVLYYSDADAAAAVVAAVERSGAKAAAIKVDVGDETSVERAFDQTAAALGVPDILVNSAGLNQTSVAVADMATAQWERLLRTDLTGAFFTCRRFIRDLRQRKQPGRIVNISSIHQDVARAGAADYDAAKGGLRNLTRTLALECGPLRINVNAIAPGMILTPMNERAVEDAAVRRKDEAAIPWGRAGTAEEVAGLVVFLASPAADYITGTTVTIDGGLSLVLGQGA